MKKVFLCVMIVLTCISSSFAQPSKIEKSVPFDEPEYGWNKILQLKNGNTFFFHAENKEGIQVVVYDKDRKIISKKTIVGKDWDADKLKVSKILGLYEISGEPVLFMVQGDEKIPTLYRIRFNPTTAAVVKEDVLGTLPKVTLGQGFAMAYGHVDASDIIVEKDPASECYAVILFNSFAHDRSERIKVLHFDGTHKKLNEAYYESPGGAYKYLRYIGSVVDGDKRVFVTTYGYNGKKGGDELSRVIVSKLNAGDTSFKHKLLDFSEDFDNTRSVMLYNHATNKIQLLTLTVSNTKRHFMGNVTETNYSTLISYLDPETLALTDIKPVGQRMVVDYAHKHIDEDYDFTGLPQQMIINKDNTTTILSEEILLETKTTSNGGIISQKTYLGPVGVSELSDTGAETSGYTISKKQQADGILSPLYLSARGKGIFQPAISMNFMKRSGNTNQFMSFDYINSPKGRYIIFNDLPSNSARDEDEKKRKTMVSVSQSNTMCYKLNNGSVDKSFLFGSPEDKESFFAYIESSDFNKDVNTYATLIIERDGRDKQARIAWVSFQ